MDNKNIIDKEKIREIVTKVVTKLFSEKQSKPSSSKKLLMLFTGSLANYDIVMNQLRSIISNEYDTTIVLSESFLKLKSIEDIEKELNPDRILTNLDNYQIREEVRRADLILIPFLTRNTVAKVLNAITDSIPTNLIFTALMLKKKIIAVRDGADPEMLDCIPCATPDAPAFIQSLMRKNLELLKQIGIELFKSDQLEEAVENFFTNEKHSERGNRSKSLSHGFPQSRREIITSEDLKKVLKNKEKTLFVSSNAIITDVAKELAKKEEIEIVRI